MKTNKVSEGKIERLLTELALLKIRDVLMVLEDDNSYYGDLSNIEEKVELGRKVNYNYGYEFEEIDYLIFWKNGFLSFSKMKRTSLRNVSEPSKNYSPKKLELRKVSGSEF